MQTIDFKLGEKKNVSIKVINTLSQVFEVSTAAYILKSGEEVEASGTCEIRNGCSDYEMILSALISPKRNRCTYILRFTYDIFPEKFIYDVQVRVS